MSVLSRIRINAGIFDYVIKRIFKEVLATNTLAATGSASTDAAGLNDAVVFVTGADGTKGVILPVAEIDMQVTVVNTVSNQDLKVYPASLAQINALTVTSGAFTVTAGTRATFYCDVAKHWYTAASNTVTGVATSATASELNTLAGVVAGTVTASKALVVDSNKDLAALRDVTMRKVLGSTDPLNVNGLAAAQGGAATVTGGTSSTSGNAGGASNLTGGTPGATGVGGAAAVTGAVGGATSGTGGAVTVTGGAGTNGNSVGGAATVTAGAGQGTAAGAVASLIAGASGAGATGNGGATNVTGGVAASTAGTGGAVNVTGGLGTTTGNGGAVTVTSGTAGATGASGAVTVTSGTAAGGATGAVTVTTGNATVGVPGTATLSAGAAQTATVAGGAVNVTGGTGNTSGAGGAVTVTSGTGGNAGAGGAINLTVGAATGANGASVTVTAGNGNGGTNGGGNINLVPGTAVSTGTPGEMLVNGAAGTFEVAYTAPLMTTVVPATGTAQPIYLATRAMRLKKAYMSVVTHGTSETIQLTKDSTGTAPGAGTAMLAAVLTPAVSNTPVTAAVVATVATVTLAAGDRISFLTGGTIGAAAGLSITLLLVPV